MRKMSVGVPRDWWGVEECFDEPHLAIDCGSSDGLMPSSRVKSKLTYAVKVSIVENGGRLVLMKRSVVGCCWK